jgi:hypothetical protein
MDTSCSGMEGIPRTPYPGLRKVWKVHLSKPLAFPTDHALSVQLPPGDYTLSERDDIHYALYASREFLVELRVTELDYLRAHGDLIIAGTWP